VIRAVIFDFDGVIANSEPLHFEAFRLALIDDAVTLTERNYYDSYLGYDDLGVFRAVSRDQGLNWSDEHVKTLARRKAGRLADLERTRSLLFPGAESVVQRLAATMPLAIASGALRDEIRRVLDTTRLSQYFAAIVAAEDTPVSKPAPDPYQLAVAKLSAATGLSLAPAECVAVEDSRWGLESARAAGLRTIAITHTYPAGELRSADLIIDSLDTLGPANLRARPFA